MPRPMRSAEPRVMPRPSRPALYKNVHSESFPIDQKAPIVGDVLIHPREVVKADSSVMNKNYVDELAFNEEPVTIRLDPSTEANAPTSVPIWVNGKGAEVLLRGKWFEVIYLPVGVVLTIKRKYLERLIAAKLDRVTTDYGKPGEENPQNKINRFTSTYQSFQVLNDPNPKGMAWLSEMRRRNF